MWPVKKFAAGLGLLLLSLPAFGADLAILHNGFSIRHERRETLGPVTRLYLRLTKAGMSTLRPTRSNGSRRISRRRRPRLCRSPWLRLRRKPQTLNEVINTISDRHHLDPDLINSVIHAESGFNPRAVSPKGARGLMQLMPQTASKLGVVQCLRSAG